MCPELTSSGHISSITFLFPRLIQQPLDILLIRLQVKVDHRHPLICDELIRPVLGHSRLLRREVIDGEHFCGEIVDLGHAHIGGHLRHAVVDQGQQRCRISLLHQLIVDAVQHAPLTLGAAEVVVQASVSRVGERLGAGQGNRARLDIGHAVLTVVCRLFLSEIHLDAAQLVDDVNEAVKADSDIVLYIKVKLLVQRVDRQSYAAVCKRMPETALAVSVDLHQGITEEGDDRRLLLGPIEGHEHHAVGSSHIRIRIAGVRSHKEDVDDVVVLLLFLGDLHLVGRGVYILGSDDIHAVLVQSPEDRADHSCYDKDADQDDTDDGCGDLMFLNPFTELSFFLFFHRL